MLEKYLKIRKEKNSVLCIGLDPREKKENLLPFCLNIIEKTSEFACAYKPNLQFLLPLSFEEMGKLTSAIHKANALAILDSKLSDIGSSNEAGMNWAKEMGFDAITYSPFSGNIEEMGKISSKYNMGIFALTLMSNPESKFFMRENSIEGKKGYEWIAGQIKKHNIGGSVVGATHITEQEIQKIRSLIGEDKIILFPGIGAQGGDLEKIFKYGGSNILINVARDIIYSSNPREKAEEYYNKMKR